MDLRDLNAGSDRSSGPGEAAPSSAPPSDIRIAFQPAAGPPPLPDGTTYQLLQAAVRSAPTRVDLRRRLFEMRYRLHAFDDLISDGLRELEAGGDGECLLFVGKAAVARGDLKLAVRALEAAVDRGAAAHGALAQMLVFAGDHERAARLGRERLKTAPRDDLAFTAAAEAYLKLDRREALWELCTELAAQGAWGAYVPSAMAHAACTARQREQAAHLLDTGTWLEDGRLELPRGFTSELADELSAHPRMIRLPATHATTGDGRRLDQLQRDPSPLVRELLGRIQSAVQDYVGKRRDEAGRPLIAQAPADAAIDAWAVSVGSTGFERWHIHPSGWLSGVVYLDVPEKAGPAADAREGAIGFGPFPFERKDADDVRKIIRPTTEQLLLFPSHLGHKTWPTGTGKRRLCVAFDVIPIPDVGLAT